MYRIAAIQMNSGAVVSENLQRAQKLIKESAAAGAQIIALPENFALMPRDEADRMRVAETMGGGPIQSFLAAQAKESGVWLIAGTIPLKAGQKSKFFASCLMFQPDGTLCGRYDKIHLFDVEISEVEAYTESDFFEPGSTAESNLVCVQTPMAAIGLTICYDVRFPELFRKLSAKGATLLSVPSAFTATTGLAHWETLLRARAIENLAYVVAPAQCGVHQSGRETYGHSMIIEPWGKILNQLTDEPEGFVLADIDPEKVHATRQRFPSLQHRRV